MDGLRRAGSAFVKSGLDVWQAGNAARKARVAGVLVDAQILDRFACQFRAVNVVTLHGYATITHKNPTLSACGKTGSCGFSLFDVVFLPECAADKPGSCAHQDNITLIVCRLIVVMNRAWECGHTFR